MINWLVFATFVFSMAMTCLGVLVDITYQVEYAPQIEARQNRQQTELPNYLKKQSQYFKHPVFRHHPPAKQNFALLLQELRQGDLQQPLIDEALKKSIYSLDDQWVDQKHKIPRLEHIEMLFGKIPDYDHWQLPTKPDSQLASDLIVATQVFLAWTFYHQPTGLREALARARQLSKVLLSTQDLNYKRAGLSILEKENEFLEYINNRMRHSQLLWTPVHRQELRSFRKHLQQTVDLLSPFTLSETFSEVFFTGPRPVAFCAIYKEKFQLLQWARVFLQPRIPLEPNFSQSVDNLRKIQDVAQTDCQNWQAPPPPKVSWVRWIPFYRRIYGVEMILHAENQRKIL